MDDKLHKSLGGSIVLSIWHILNRRFLSACCREQRQSSSPYAVNRLYSKMSKTEKATTLDTGRSTIPIKEPFDSDPDADVILISFDKAQFRVRSAILSFSSPVFRDMFSLPQTTDTTSTTTTIAGLPFVHMSEAGWIIDSLLRYCYPLANPFIKDANYLFCILNAAEKFDMAYVIPQIESDIRKTIYKSKDLLLFYQKACINHNEVDARWSAFQCLSLPYHSVVKHWGANTSVGGLSNLIDYHQAVSVAISDFITNFWKVDSKGKDMWGSCRKCNDIVPKWRSHVPPPVGSKEPHWWTSGLIVQDIVMEGPLNAQLLPSEETIESIRCSSCSGCVHRQWKLFEPKFKTAVIEEAKRVFTFFCHDRAWLIPFSWQIELVLPW